MSPAVTCAWVGGLLVNGAVVALLVLIQTLAWPLAVIGCALYTAALFCTVQWLRQRPEANVAPGAVSPLKPATDALLLLSVLGIGATGLVFSISLFGCAGPRRNVGAGIIYWRLPANATTSETVARWAALTTVSDRNAATFVQVVGSGFIFAGNDGAGDGPDSRAWCLPDAGGPPVLLSQRLTWPRSFVAIGLRACFIAQDGPVHYAVACSSADCRRTTLVKTLAQQPHSLLVDDGRLWFKSLAPFGQRQVWRAEASLDSVALLSEPFELPLENGDCNPRRRTHIQALSGLFLSAIPVAAAGTAVWRRFRAPSMALAVYVGWCGGALAVRLLGQPDAFEYEETCWWLAVFSALWVGCFVVLHLTERLDAGDVTWAVNIGSVGFFLGAHGLLGIPFEPAPWRWAVYNVGVLVPLLLLALTVGTYLPLLLASAGVCMDALILAAGLKTVFPSAPPALLTALTLGVVGSGVVAAGLGFSRHQEELQRRLSARTEACLAATTGCAPRQAMRSLHSWGHLLSRAAADSNCADFLRNELSSVLIG